MLFITGDTLLFDAYRRWWVQNPGHVFALRRIAQYAPILNFRDAKSSIAFNEEIFENTRRAIEPLLIYFNLAARAGPAEGADGALGEHGAMTSASRTRIQGGREHFALLLRGRNPLESAPFKVFAQKVQGILIGDLGPRFHRIRDEWQEFERLAIGVYHKLIEVRLNEEHRRELRECLVEPKGRGIDAFINKRLIDLYHYGAMRYVIGAFDTLREFVRHHPVTSRAPIAIRLRATAPGRNAQPRPIDVSRVAEALMDGDYNLDLRLLEETWLRNPERLFALVARMALGLSLWDQAAIYAQLAVSSEAAESIKAKTSRDDRADYFELLYLRALANRFAVGAMSSLIAGSELRARQLMDLALADLDACIDYHSGSDEGERHILRELRARSERAALQGFYACWLLLQSKRASGPSEAEIEPIVLRVKGIHDGLRSACEMAHAADERARALDGEEKSSEHSTFLLLVMKQVNLNVAAWYVFFELLKWYSSEIGSGFDLDRFMLAEARDVLKRRLAANELADAPVPMRIVVNLFLWLFDGDRRAGAAVRDLLASLQTEGMRGWTWRCWISTEEHSGRGSLRISANGPCEEWLRLAIACECRFR